MGCGYSVQVVPNADFDRLLFKLLMCGNADTLCGAVARIMADLCDSPDYPIFSTLSKRFVDSAVRVFVALFSHEAGEQTAKFAAAAVFKSSDSGSKLSNIRRGLVLIFQTILPTSLRSLAVMADAVMETVRLGLPQQLVVPIVPAKLARLLQNDRTGAECDGSIDSIITGNEEESAADPAVEVLAARSSAGGAQLFSIEDFDHGSSVTILSKSEKWRQCTVVDIDEEGEDGEEPAIRIHYEGYSEEFDEWVQIDSESNR